jgi:hypothetical protein
VSDCPNSLGVFCKQGVSESQPAKYRPLCSAIAQVPPPRYAGVVFNVRVKEPQSIAGRSWNRAMDVSPIAPLTFIVLKLTGVIAWSWWWVLSPLWISGILFAVALCAVLVLLRLPKSSLDHQD